IYAEAHRWAERNLGGDHSFDRTEVSARQFFEAENRYEAAFRDLLKALPDGQTILQYAQAATAIAEQFKICEAMRVGQMDLNPYLKTYGLFAVWRSWELQVIDLGYKTVSFADLYNSVPWLSANKKLKFMIYKLFVQRCADGEEPIRHADI